MSVVYVREQGSMVRKRGERLFVTLGKEEVFDIPLANLEQLVLVGNVQMTTQTATLLLRSHVDVVFMSTYGKFRGRLMLNESRFAQLRHAQLRLCDDDRRSLDIAAQIVAGKVNNQRVVLQRRAEEDAYARQALNGMMSMLQSALQANDLDQLRGYEGKAAAYYFDGVKTFFDPTWGFTKREYYPPPDPANAMLSFAYTLLLKDVVAKIQIVGLDPYLGFFHTLGYNRPGLALDIMEEFRPSISDSVVLTLVRSNQITLDDFEKTNRPDLPVRLAKPAIEKLIEAYEQRLHERIFHPLANGQTSYRRAIELQVRRMAQVILGDAPTYESIQQR
ncbi:CRISPR-associated endonuclease Cas1 [Phototrophicus methaneseepsis]|uniref:CRISPR-associated endonuclease Cas1 n=1 Tax=Phototrophicus methaneseepsis TaxID=2710758 RepID=A0A7S8IDL2_9CHLR|nr:CRISPR-associated endonuclease Cas1 [Phototrophicus methaneseepsis]QPC80923.1 CRISPR-associated endonuclease Cas1 [Phototrophicus methaneseepsis]